MDKHTIKLTREKETKNTIRFKEVVGDDGKPPVLDSIYVPKWVVGDTTEIEVTLSPVAAKAAKGK